MLSDSTKAQLTLAYKRFQAYADLVHDLKGLDDAFIDFYDKGDVQGCKYTLSKMSDLYHEELQGAPFTQVER